MGWPGVRARLTRSSVFLPGDDERGAGECADPASPDQCAPGGDPNSALPPSPVSAAPQPSTQEPTGSASWSRSKCQLGSRFLSSSVSRWGTCLSGEDTAASCEVEQEQEKEKEKEVVPGVGEALRIFMEVRILDASP